MLWLFVEQALIQYTAYLHQCNANVKKFLGLHVGFSPNSLNDLSTKSHAEDIMNKFHHVLVEFCLLNCKGVNSSTLVSYVKFKDL